MSSPHGLFITGTDTDVGKTYVAAQIAAALKKVGCNVGVYKPVASGCFVQDGEVVADDAVQLWEAAGKPKTLHEVCPLRFKEPLAPHLAAEAEGVTLDFDQMVSGLDAWRDADVVIVEGAGGLMSPVGEQYVADLAAAFGYPLVVVAANKIGVINQTLQTLIVAATFREGLPIAGIVLNQRDETPDESVASNLNELQLRCTPSILASVGQNDFKALDLVDWSELIYA